MTTHCPFCSLDRNRILFESATCVAIEDGFPVSPGHVLIITRRHLPSFFDTTEAERRELGTLLEQARNHLAAQRSPDGFNIGINDGAAAGQTVPHLHIHLIPRYRGDRPEPRGGVRWVLPDTARYWPD